MRRNRGSAVSGWRRRAQLSEKRSAATTVPCTEVIGSPARRWLLLRRAGGATRIHQPADCRPNSLVVRTAFHEHLGALIESLSQMCGLAGVATERSTHALLQADLVVAEQVITDNDELVRMRNRAGEAAFVLLARQAPVAGDLRLVVGSLQNFADAERMGGLALHVAKIARRRHAMHALPEQVNGYFAEMGTIAVHLGNSAKDVVRPATLGWRRRSAATTTPWTRCRGTSSPCSWTSDGHTVSQPPST